MHEVSNIGRQSLWICCHLQVLWYSTHVPASCFYCSLSHALAGLSPACHCKEFKAKSKRLPSDYFALLNNHGFSYVPSTFRSVGTQKEKPSQTVTNVFDGFLCSIPYKANTLSCLSYETLVTRIIQRCKGTHII